MVILGGLAELFSGAISMGLGAYLAAVTESKTYEVEEARERHEVTHMPNAEEEEIYEIFEEYNLSRETVKPVVEALKTDHDMWVKVNFLSKEEERRRLQRIFAEPILQFMMDFELKLEKPALNRAWISALVMGISYFLGEY